MVYRLRACALVFLCSFLSVILCSLCAPARADIHYLNPGDSITAAINSVDPGSMDTVMHRLAEPTEDPAVWAKPETVTPIFGYLASDESASVNGQRFDAQAFAAEYAARQSR